MPMPARTSAATTARMMNGRRLRRGVAAAAVGGAMAAGASTGVAAGAAAPAGTAAGLLTLCAVSMGFSSLWFVVSMSVEVGGFPAAASGRGPQEDGQRYDEQEGDAGQQEHPL